MRTELSAFITDGLERRAWQQCLIDGIWETQALIHQNFCCHSAHSAGVPEASSPIQNTTLAHK